MKIEAGKYYKDASGNKRGPMKPGSSYNTFVSMDDFGSPLFWTLSGGCVCPQYNITAEWADDQIGTLQELDVKPGDVVEWLDATEYKHMIVREYEVLKCGIYAGEVRAVLTEYGEGIFGKYCKFRLISRATPTPSIDLTAITTPFGLLDKATQDALIAHGGPYEYSDGEGGWLPTRHCSDVPRYAHRVKPGPKRETVTKGAWLGRVTGEVTVCDECNCTITYDTIDGVIDMATYRVVAK